MPRILTWDTPVRRLLELVLETFSWFEEEGAVLPMDPGWSGARDGATRSTSMESWSALSSAEADRSSASELISILSLCSVVLSFQLGQGIVPRNYVEISHFSNIHFSNSMSFRLNNRHGKACCTWRARDVNLGRGGPPPGRGEGLEAREDPAESAGLALFLRLQR